MHYRFDYYRFSRRAVREVFFEGFDRVKVVSVLDPPRMIGHGYKPINRRQQATRVVRRNLSRVKRRLRAGARRAFTPQKHARVRLACGPTSDL